MPKGVCNNTGRTQFKKGMIPWNKGIPHSTKTKEKISKAKRGKTSWTEERKQTMSKIAKERDFGKWMVGKTYSEEYKKKMSEGHKKIGVGKWMKGRKLPLNTRLKIKAATRKGSECNFWKGGITPLRKAIRESFEGENWRIAVFQRDRYTCQDCGVNNGGLLESHHKKPFAVIFSDFLQEYNQFSPIEDKDTLVRIAINYKSFWDINNGKTLCKECHKGVKKYA
jgi:hypothetical protein